MKTMKTIWNPINRRNVQGSWSLLAFLVSALAMVGCTTTKSGSGSLVSTDPAHASVVLSLQKVT